MSLFWLRQWVTKYLPSRGRTSRPTKQLCRRRAHVRIGLETLEDRCLLSGPGNGITAAGLSDAALAYDMYSQWQAMKNPQLNSSQQGQATGYFYSDIANMIGATVSAIPGVDTKTIGLAFTTAGDFGHLASLIWNGGLTKNGTPEGIALQDLQEAKTETLAGNSNGWHLANAVFQSLTSGTPISGLNDLPQGTTRNDLSTMAAIIMSYEPNDPDDAYPGINGATTEGSLWQQFDADAKGVGASLPINWQGMTQGLSDLLALAGDISALSGGPVGGIVGDALTMAHDALTFGFDASDPNSDPITVDGDLATLGSDAIHLMDDVMPAPNPNSQPLSVTVTPPSSGANQLQGGVNFDGTIATFSDPNVAANQAAPPTSDYAAYINWGDGSSSFGQIAAASGGGANYTVTGTHLYAAPGDYSVSVVVAGNGAQGQAANNATVNANTGGTTAPIQGITVAGQSLATQSSLSVNGPVATVYAPASGSYTASIDWGDGSTSTGQVVANSNGTFSVTGSHAYSQDGSYLTSVLVSDSSGDVASAFGSVATASSGLVVSSNPTNQNVAVGQTATFTAAASGTPTPTVQWQVSTDNGSTWSALSGATSTTLTLNNVTAGMNGNEYEAVFTNSGGSVTSSTATLTVGSTATPTSTYIIDDEGNLFTVNDATGQTSFLGSTGTVMFDIALSPSGQLYGLGEDGNLYQINASNAVATLVGPILDQSSGQPSLSDANAMEFRGDGALFVAAQNAVYQVNPQTAMAQQVLTLPNGETSAGDLLFDSSGDLFVTTNDGSLVEANASLTSARIVGNTGIDDLFGLVWSNGSMYGFSNSQDAIYQINPATAAAAFQANLTPTDGVQPDGVDGATSTPPSLAAPVITSNPTNQNVAVGQAATFTASANGTPTPTVQWQVSTDGGASWNNLSNSSSVSGAATGTLTLSNVTASMSGNEYRAVFSNGAGNPATTSEAELSVNATTSAPSLTSGTSAGFVVGFSGSFLVTATGSPTPVLSESGALPSGVTFTDNGNGTATLGGSPAAGTNGTYQFTIAAHNGVGSDATQSFTLTVSLPTLTPPPPPPPPPPTPQPPSVPGLLALLNEFLPHTETMNANGTTITDSLFGIPLVETYNFSGSLVSVTVFGFNITFLF